MVVKKTIPILRNAHGSHRNKAMMIQKYINVGTHTRVCILSRYKEMRDIHDRDKREKTR